MGKRLRTATQEPLPQKPTPAYSSDVTYEGIDYTAIKEGLATVLFPKRSVKKDKHGKEYEVVGEVFYNPIQQFNRDLSVLAIKTFADIWGEEKSKKGRKKMRGEKEGKAAATDAAEVKPTEEATEMPDAPTVAADAPAGAAEALTTEAGDKPAKKTPKFAILDALSATGLRALRYTLELPQVTSATANDLDLAAVDSIRRNIRYNSEAGSSACPETLSAADAVGKIVPSLGNAQHHMYSVLSTAAAPPCPSGEFKPNFARYEVIDLDPYGTAAPFMDAAVQAVSDGGLLCITCTDAGVWASTGYAEKCYSLYGGLPVKGEWSHEAGLRLILNNVAQTAGKYGLYIEPLLSLSIDFYARVWVRVRNGPVHVKKLASTTMVVYNCDEGCGSWYEQRLGKAKEQTDKSGKGTFTKFGLARAPTVGENCPECKSPMHLGGPMWAGPLHSEAFVERFLTTVEEANEAIYSTIPRITGMLQTALQEASLNGHPFFHIPSKLSKTLHCEAPPSAALRGALIGLGYKVSRSHCKPSSIKTDAPHHVVWEIMKRWIESKPRKEGACKEGTPGFNIMNKPKREELDIKFDIELGKDADKESGVVRYQVNPTANWGPMARAGGQRVEIEKAGEEEGEGESKKRVSLRNDCDWGIQVDSYAEVG
ncbi:N2,N2-dimethylguanosine tRNA methyltransferase-domain-containing protein [Pyronema domesticum]|nr:N2,N2-dimethylguanosine tRNA methyltransferase-domain-containing protein [Pyronema domesticum]